MQVTCLAERPGRPLLVDRTLVPDAGLVYRAAMHHLAINAQHTRGQRTRPSGRVLAWLGSMALAGVLGLSGCASGPSGAKGVALAWGTNGMEIST